MKFLAPLVLATGAFACLHAQAQFVKGNDAVERTAAGVKVSTPPVPTSVGRVCEASAKCYAGSWRMVETETGLQECTEPFARPGTCRVSTYGRQKLSRVWVIKRGREWQQCQFPDIASKCTPLFARPPANLPADAIQ